MSGDVNASDDLLKRIADALPSLRSQVRTAVGVRLSEGARIGEAGEGVVSVREIDRATGKPRKRAIGRYALSAGPLPKTGSISVAFAEDITSASSGTRSRPR